MHIHVYLPDAIGIRAHELEPKVLTRLLREAVEAELARRDAIVDAAEVTELDVAADEVPATSS
jgi:hypothetical protein